ncbi:enoyl-CoA hydratase-related protein [Actinoplanes regularis]|uniref:2-(1,2-epoxy-1,2-dihydrophenyl)acetyl-CoA isomerase n=1 Tax=Actinoplanes regularis TaxID=52697 RepID=A0A238VC78_9ACTN|nr:enoyl-CoA hydratase-related protein [Actinoplanes regularis]GIE83569.1 enoyl-CoA hydratase [Actinoplanes regularis]GLW29460.1 enoyl-CoA hydratase [Actinoplanes regularis]SNR32010.1 2-(1,2-epoxy-1,2-dihydrophenyl)acetyl-CoA isomerase [Actinoplanes regularis]
MTDALLVDRTDAVVTLTLNRPEAMNSFTVDLKVALRDTLAELETDRSCRAIVLAGAGAAFCGGQDLREHAELLGQGHTDLNTVQVHYNPIAQRLASMPKPVIAAVRGMAAGAGASLAMLADFRIGGPKTSFLMAFANVGLAGDSGISWSLPRIVGHARAVELLLLAEPVKAQRAYEIGMLTRLLEDDEQVLPVAQELAARMAAGPTLAYGAIKRELSIGDAGTLSDALAAEAQAQAICGATADHRNAVDAFVNKRKPVYEGR